MQASFNCVICAVKIHVLQHWSSFVENKTRTPPLVRSVCGKRDLKRKIRNGGKGQQSKQVFTQVHLVLK